MPTAITMHPSSPAHQKHKALPYSSTSHSSLAHMKGVKQLAKFYRCGETLEDVKAARYEAVRRDYPGLIKKCLEGTHAIMMDDGLNQDLVYPYRWHRQIVPRVSRIVRIEAIAAEIIEQLAKAAGPSQDLHGRLGAEISQKHSSFALTASSETRSEPLQMTLMYAASSPWSATGLVLMSI